MGRRNPFPPSTTELNAIALKLILDGEIIAMRIVWCLASAYASRFDDSTFKP